MNKALLVLLIVVASAAVVLSLPCDGQKGCDICSRKHTDCTSNLDPSLSAAEKKKATCQCHYTFSECLYHIDCNGTFMWNLMSLCTNEGCDKCSFFVYGASSMVFPSIILLCVGVFVALFM